MSRLRCWWRGHHIWSMWQTALIGRDLIAYRDCACCSKHESKDAFE